MPNDLQTFALVFAVIWGGLALYLVWLDRTTRGLAARLERLESGDRPR